MITEIALVFLVNVITSFVKKWVYPKYGRIGTQVLAFLAALLGALYYTYSFKLPGLKAFVESALAIFSLAVAFYEVVLKYIPFFQGDSSNPIVPTPVEDK